MKRKAKRLSTMKTCMCSYNLHLMRDLLTARPLPKAPPQVRQMSHFSEFVVACVAAGPRTRLNHLYGPCYIQKV